MVCNLVTVLRTQGSPKPHCKELLKAVGRVMEGDWKMGLDVWKIELRKQEFCIVVFIYTNILRSMEQVVKCSQDCHATCNCPAYWRQSRKNRLNNGCLNRLKRQHFFTQKSLEYWQAYTRLWESEWWKS